MSDPHPSGSRRPWWTRRGALLALALACGLAAWGLDAAVAATQTRATAAKVARSSAVASDKPASKEAGPVGECSGEPGAPCTQRRLRAYQLAREGQAFSLNAGGKTGGQRFKKGPEGHAILLQSLLGVLVLLGLAVALSVNRRAISWRPVVWGLGLQAAFAFIVLNPVVSEVFFSAVDSGVRSLLSFAEGGIAFVLQGTEPHTMTHQAAGQPWAVDAVFVGAKVSPALKTIGFWVLPTIIFFSALMAVLYHLKVMQLIVRLMARGMQFMLRTSGAETLSCTANIFVGQTEAPLMIKPFVGQMTRSELMTIMTGGFATVAGGVLALYVAILRDVPDIAGHLVAASFMGAPGAIAISKIMFPETERPQTAGTLEVHVERPDANTIEALARGATEGMTLVLNVVAMLIAFVAMVFLINAALGAVGVLFGWELSLQRLLGWALSPLAWCMGVPWQEATLFGKLLGEKLVLTELIAYLDLQQVGAAFSERTTVMASYALCGFANVASIGIQIGGIGGMAPERRADLARLGLRAMFAGALVSCLSAVWAGAIFQLFQ